MTTLLLMRHGRTTANSTGVLAGRSAGVDLDEVGLRQADAAAQRISGLPIAGVVTSPLQRCRRTTERITAGTQWPVHTDRGLIECGYGDWTGRKLAELAKEKLWATVQSQPSAVQFPGGEALAAMSARAVSTVRGWNARLAAEADDQAIWVAVSHGDIIKAILADALGMHLDSFQRITVDPASISIIRYTQARPYVVTMNSTAGDLGHLAPAKKARGARRKRSDDAAVGGGMGSGQ